MFTYRERTRLGEIVGDEIIAISWPDSVQAVIRRGMTPSRGSERFALKDVKLEAPFRPGKIIAIGLNYADHAKESGAKVPDEPLIFSKFSSSVIGPGDTIRWRESLTSEVDWEVELAVIIGQRGRDISEDDAMKHVFGYTVANDVSARDLQLVKDAQWTRGKSLDTFCPLGPWVVTRDEIADPHNLSLRTTVNGKVMQDSNTSNLIFTIPQLIAHTSAAFTLEPADVILTGTPPGVGMGMKPKQFLKDGDVVTVSVEGIGELTNPCQIIT